MFRPSDLKGTPSSDPIVDSSVVPVAQPMLCGQAPSVQEQSFIKTQSVASRPPVCDLDLGPFIVDNNLQNCLANFQRSLVEEIRDTLAQNRQHLVLEVSGLLKGGSPSPAISHVYSTNSNLSSEPVADGKELEPEHRSSIVTTVDEDDLDDEENEPAPQLKVDGAFGSIFATAGLDDLEEPHYYVEMKYKETGYAQKIARSEAFINTTLAIISVNAAYIGIDADWNDAEALYFAKWPFIVSENLFCAYFTFELVTRFLAFKKKTDCCRDGWFRFDTALVFLMVFETWILGPILAIASDGAALPVPVGPLRLLRMARLTRLARLMRSLPELVTMVKGMVVASRAVCSSLMMVILMIYVFAIVLNMGMKTEDDINRRLSPRNFETIPRSMWTLLMDGTFMDSTGNVLSTLLFSGKPICIMCSFVFMTFILLSAVNIMNMLIGVLCEVVSQVAQGEKDEAAIKLVKDSILMDLKRFDNGDGMITKDELRGVMNDPVSKVVLKQLNVDRLFLLELQQLLFPKPDSEVHIKGIMELMLMCRGDLSVTVKHLASAQAAQLSTMNSFEKRLNCELAKLSRPQSPTMYVPAENTPNGNGAAMDPPAVSKE